MNIPTLLPIPIGPFAEGRRQRISSQDDRIKSNASYLACIDGRWYAGKFIKCWYGWSFSNWGNAGRQLDSIDGPLFEILTEAKP